jgi:hypothetical protein
MAKNTWLRGAALALIAALALAGCSKANAQAGGSSGSSGGGGSASSAVKEAPASDFSYGLTADKKGVSITKYTGKGGVVVIPTTIESLPVTEIGKEAFSRITEKDITEIIIPASVTKIGTSAFAYKRELIKLNLPTNIEEVGVTAFEKCEELNNLIIPDSISSIKFVNSSGRETPDNYAFQGCGKLPLATRAKIEALGYKGKF